MVDLKILDIRKCEGPCAFDIVCQAQSQTLKLDCILFDRVYVRGVCKFDRNPSLSDFVVEKWENPPYRSRYCHRRWTLSYFSEQHCCIHKGHWLSVVQLDHELSTLVQCNYFAKKVLHAYFVMLL